MPTGYVKEIAKEKHVPVQKVEQQWQQAKNIAKHQGKSVGYGYITNIFKKISHVGKGKNK